MENSKTLVLESPVQGPRAKDGVQARALRASTLSWATRALSGLAVQGSFSSNP